MQDTLTVRTAGPGDVGAVDLLLRRSYPTLLKADYPPSVMVLAVPLISRAKIGLVCSGTYYVVEDENGTTLGAGGWSPKPLNTRAADIRHVATDPAAVRRGVGRALIAHIFARAAAAGVQRFDCLATRTAVPFYRAMGFEALAPLDVRLAKAIHFPVVQMRRDTGRDVES